jgi:UDPglucose 6-dehydrogenase
MEAAWAAGATIRAYDPQAAGEARRIYGEREDLVLCQSAEDALVGADALAVVTEWREFRSPSFERIRDALKQPVVFDGRNIYDPETMAQFGFDYYAIGRGLRPGAAA